MAQKFKKGVDPRRNTEGRPPGKGNKTTEQMRAVIGDIIHENLPRIRKVIRDMEDEKAVLFIERLLRHYLPPPINSIEQFSEEDIDLLIDRLKQQQNKTLN